MRILILVILLLTAAGGGMFYYTYQASQSPLEERQEAALQTASAEAAVAEVHAVDFYHGDASYQVFDITNEEGIRQFIWVEEEPDDLEEEAGDEEEAASDWEPSVVIRDAEAGISPDAARETAAAEASPVQWRHTKLGIRGGEPVYEVHYINEDEQFGYLYVSFEDGSYAGSFHFAEQPL
ncbi:DUF5590 domain-containing protein [Alkalicoccus chagannorensis]|uniref:DUF5590 domain-containing protein n=1 Tax=Alkalicoccus chagannorensis TaxID=427072 RepID=UPI00040DA844|nr:DUF5590 domain-containing protein [Alkalicoccus chagannorensis]